MPLQAVNPLDSVDDRTDTRKRATGRRTQHVARLANPDHLRSPLLTLSARGKAELERIRAGEIQELRKMVAPFSRADLAKCSSVLEHLRIEFAMRAAVLEQSKADIFEEERDWLSTG